MEKRMTKDEALKLALETLEADPLEMVADANGHMVFLKDKAITAIKEALAQQEQEPVAWEQFYPDMGKPQLEMKVEGPRHVVCQCDKCKAQEQDNAYIYASNLAKTIWQKHYIKESPKFALLDTTEGVLTQIDNMTCGLVREKPAQPEKEPVAWGVFDDNLHDMFFAKEEAQEMVRLKGDGSTVKPLYTTPPQRKWVGLTYKEKHEIRYSHMTSAEFIDFIEAKLKDKNTIGQE
jgi:hypothetical protein